MYRALIATSAALFLSAACSSNQAITDTTTSSGVGGTATFGKGVGEACGETRECRSGLACEGGACQPAGTQEAGDPCVISGECAAELYCEAGMCAPAGSGMESDDCVTDGDCAKGLRCALVGLAAQCVPEGMADLGGACTSSADCFGGLGCVDGACAPLPPGVPPFGLPWEGVDCPEETGPVETYFEVPRAGTTGDFLRLPYPNDVRRQAGTGVVDLSGFPTPGVGPLGYDAVQRYVDAVEATADGWSTYGGVYFRFSGEIDLATAQDQVQIIDLTDGAPLNALSYFYSIGRSNYLCANRFYVAPSATLALTPGHAYAVVLFDGIKTKDGGDVSRPADLVALLDGSAPSDADVAAHYDAYAPLRAYLAAESIAPATVLNASVFTTGSPRNEVEALQGVIDGLGAPNVTGWTLCDGNAPSPCPDANGPRACGSPDADFHELHALVELPIFQRGTAPYLTEADGGDIALENGLPAVQRTEQVCLALTVPKGPPPAGGWPTVVYAHGTGGMYRGFIEQGLAKRFAQGLSDGQGNTVAMAMLGIDQVQHGPRAAGSTVSPDDLFFNFGNPKAALGNPIQGAADQMSLLRLVPTIDFPTNSPTGEAFSLAAQVAFWGHSQGATEGALAAPHGDWAGLVFTGQGASLRHSLVSKTSPVNIAGALPFILQDPAGNGSLADGSRHPVLQLLQHHIDGADPVNYARQLALSPPNGVEAHHVFQVFGQSDTFTPTTVQLIHARTARLGAATPDASVSTPDDLGTPLPVPVSGNLTVGGKTVTAIVRQYAPAGTNDGHFVAFDVAAAQSDVERFLAGLFSGITAPIVGN